MVRGQLHIPVSTQSYQQGISGMPEAPELYLIREWMEPRLLDREVIGFRTLRPLVLRNMLDVPAEKALVGRRFESVERDGKLLMFGFDKGLSMVVSPMLAGELRLVEVGARVQSSVILEIEISGGESLRYLDQRRMGQVYLLQTAEVHRLARLERQGPDVLDSPLDYDEMCAALRGYRGELKNVLTGGKFVGGLGNAYADEVLWSAKLSPFVKVSALTEADRLRLHVALTSGILGYVGDLRSAFAREGLEPRKFRSVLRIHGQAGKPCPECGTRISAVKARRRETNFCRKCQPGSLFAT